MKINRTSDDNRMPEWAFENKETNTFADKDAVSIENIKRIAGMKNEITEDDMVLEKDTIEKCATTKTPYFYNESWTNSIKSELKEYAMACGMNMDMFKSVCPLKFAVKTAGVKQMIKTASTIVLSDPFKIDEKLASSRDMVSSRDKKGEWKPEVKKQSELADRPSMSGIVPSRGSDDITKNPESRVAKGQNSISEPDAIEKLSESTEEDTGARLKRENKEKVDSRKTKHQEWEREKIEAMEKKDILPNRHVFPTEVMNAQPGIKGEIFDFDSVPEKTKGEQIKGANVERKEAIRGKEKQKHEFVTSKSPTRTISEDFANELEKHLKNK